MIKGCSVQKKKIRKMALLEAIVLVVLVACIYVNFEGSNVIQRAKYRICSLKNRVSYSQMNNMSSRDVDISKYVQGENSDIKQQIANIGNNAKVAYILQNFDSYPLTLMKGVARNPKTLDFAYNFLEKAHGYYSEDIDLANDLQTKNNRVPLLIQWDERWGYASYCSSTIGISGCGPTCLSMVYIALTGDRAYNPLKMARFSTDGGYAVEEVGTSWSLFTDGANRLGLSSSEISSSEESIINSLNQGKYIIASMGPGIFTGSGHFIVICGYKNGKFIINDPFNKEFSSKKWSYSEFGNEIKTMWALGRQ